MIQARHISSMPYTFKELAQMQLDNSTNWGGVTNLGNYAAGKYLIILTTLLRQTTGLTRNIYFRYKAGNTTSHESIWNVIDGTTSYWNGATMITEIELKQSEDIIVQSKAEAACNFTANYIRIYVLKVS